MNIRPLGPTTANVSGGTRRATGARFTRPGQPAEASGAAPVDTMGLEGLLSLQEVEPAAERDARSRSRGEALLAALTRLQLHGLDAASDSALLEQIARLTQDLPQAADPGLREAVAAIALRVHVELARQHMAPGRCRS